MKIITRKEAKAQGLKRYFTGEPCKRGHVAERFSGDGSCVECRRLYNRQYHAENRDKVLERRRQYREENPEYLRQYYAENREYFRQYREENRERRLEYNRQHYAENRERRLEYNRQHYAENREYYRQCSRQYREENRELFAARKAKRRAAKLQRTLAHEEELTQFVMEEAAQQANDMEELFGTPFHVDHMLPMQGEEVSGFHVYYNLQVIPAHLNISKGNRMRYTKPLEWLADAT